MGEKISLLIIISAVCLWSCEAEYRIERDHKKVIHTLPDEFVVLAGTETMLYFNEFVFGEDTGIDNTLKHYLFGVCAVDEAYAGLVSLVDDGILINAKDYSAGIYPLQLDILYSKDNELLRQIRFSIKVLPSQGLSSGKHILLLGDSWTGINDPNTGEGFVYYMNDFFESLGGILPVFTGTQNITLREDVKHEGRGGYTIRGWTSRPEEDRENPFWNMKEDKLDFSNYRKNLCQLENPIDLVCIQLGVNESIRRGFIKRKELDSIVKRYMNLIQSILEDSPNCKIVVNLCGLDKGHLDSWGKMYGDAYDKDIYQFNVYMQRTRLYEELSQRSDFGRSVYWGQSVLGLNRWENYIDATHPSIEGYKQIANTLGPQIQMLLSD